MLDTKNTTDKVPENCFEGKQLGVNPVDQPATASEKAFENNGALFIVLHIFTVHIRHNQRSGSLWKGQDVIVHPRIDIASIEVPDACLTKLVIGVDDSAPAIQDHNLNIIKRLKALDSELVVHVVFV